MERKILIPVIIFVVIILGVGIYGIVSQNDKPITNLSASIYNNIATSTSNGIATTTSSQNQNMKHLITIKTNFGDIVFETYDSDAPLAVNNFVTLAKSDFYNGLTFHRVIEGFMIQGGDPNCSSANPIGPCGTGGSGKPLFKDELNPNADSYKAGYVRGVVAMANSGPDTNGSQFFIMQQDNALAHNYTIFGKVVSGIDTVDKIAAVKTDSNDRPLSPVIIESVTVKSL